MVASEIRRERVSRLRGFSHWSWHIHEEFVKIDGERHYLRSAVDHEGEFIENYITKKRYIAAILAFLKIALKRHRRAEIIVID